MSITAIVLIVETGLILVACIGFLLFLRWHKKKRQAIEIEQLLDVVNNLEQARKKQLTEMLQEKYAVESSESIESAACMVEAEKQFLQLFIKQQLEHAPITFFYQNLCELLDQYVYFIPASKDRMCEGDDTVSDRDEQDQAVNTGESENNPSTKLTKSATSDETELKKPVKVTDEQDKKLAEVSEDTKDDKQQDSENETAADADDEPDWGEAFAESGDEIDEDVKAGYEAETKKD